jgi:hypothetical protein
VRAVVAGLVCLAVAGVTVATRTAAERRSVRATAVVESTRRGAFVESETGRRSFPVWGRVRYDVDGSPVRSTVRLGSCGTAGVCPFLERRDQQVAVVYDVDRPGSARLAATAVGGSPFLHPLVLLFGGLGLLFLVAAAINLAVEI